MYQALYRKYRPSNFNEVVGQDVIVKTLGNAIKNNKVSHAYLFSGPRGTGKTSIAKIFAKMLNCENLNDLLPCNKCVSCTQINNNQNIDVIEIDAASNNSVDEIREIRNKISLVPTNSKYKIYIIDEVHMLTTQAFNALLKTLEEPPSHAIFIFATTEFYKIPKTILSRCQRFDYKKVSVDNIIKRLNIIIEKENIKIDDDALKEIARISDGGMRDAISLLDQASSYDNDIINVKDIHEINGTITDEEIENMLLNIFNNNLIEILNTINDYNNKGKDLIKIMQLIVEKLEKLLIYKNTSNYIEETNFYKQCHKISDSEKIYILIKNFSNCIGEMKKSNNVKTLFEIEIIKNINILNNNNYIEKTDIQKNEKIIEPEVEEKAVEPAIETKDESIELDDEIKKIIEIRINNSLVNVSNKKKEEFINKIELLRPLLLDPNYSKYISLLFDGKIKSLSDKNFIVIYKTDLIASQFNSNLFEIDKILKSKLNDDYKAVAISERDWEIIKNEYNKKEKKYVYIEEKVKEILNEKNEVINDIEEEFNDIIEYS